MEKSLKSSLAKKAATSVNLSGKTFSKELIVKILGYLNKNQLDTVAKVNSQFSNLVQETTLKMATNNTSSAVSLASSSLPALSTVIESISFPPPAAIQTTLPCVVTTVAPNLRMCLPVESTIRVPVIPEAMPMIVTVPDVVLAASTPMLDTHGVPLLDTDGLEKKSEEQVVQISQVLAGYAPSYAHDYVPPEVNMASVTTFANTISFNVSRYPNLTDIMDSKTYNLKKREFASSHSNAAGSRQKTSNNEPWNSTHPPVEKALLDLQYIPAEYGRDDIGKHSVTVSAAKNITIVRPEVLASGRLLTHMSPVTNTSQASQTRVTSTRAPTLSMPPTTCEGAGK